MRIEFALFLDRCGFSGVPRWVRAATVGSQRPVSFLRIGRRRRALSLKVAAAAFTIPFIVGLPARAQTLTEALSYAYNNNPQLLAQRALLRVTDEQVPQALSGWRPTVNFTGQAGEERAGFATGGPTSFSSFQTRQLDLKITQPV